MALPALAIHTQVKMAQRVFQRWGRYTKYGPTIAGLSLLPALPFLFDKPVEHLLDMAWPDKKPHLAENVQHQ
jgi:fission process protein 1